MIYILFLVSIIIYLLYLYFKTNKENFTSNKNKTTYFLIGKLNKNLDTYLQFYINKKGHDTLDYYRNNCSYDLENLNENNYMNNDLINLNTEKSSLSDMCGNQINNILNPPNNSNSNQNDDEIAENKKFINKIQNKCVIIFSFGKKDIMNVNDSMDKIIENAAKEKVPRMLTKNEKKSFKKKEYYNSINKINLGKFRREKNNEIYYLFLNIKTSENDYEYEDYTIWNNQLKKYVDENNKFINEYSKNDKPKNYLKIINTSKINVNVDGKNVKHGIPYDLHLFICKNERCNIANKDCENKFKKLFKRL